MSDKPTLSDGDVAAICDFLAWMNIEGYRVQLHYKAYSGGDLYLDADPATVILHRLTGQRIERYDERLKPLREAMGKALAQAVTPRPTGSCDDR